MPAGVYARKPAEERLWAKVDKSGECWLWTGAQGSGGAGHMKANGGFVKVHRLAWELVHGDVPVGKVIRHSCGVRACVRPEHLYIAEANEVTRSYFREKLGDPDERYWLQVEKDGPTPPHCPQIGPCWTWRGTRDSNGYGLFLIQRRDVRRAHRYAWELEHGQIPDGLHACHHCDNPSCVRPEHIFIGTQFDNMRDCARKGRTFAQRFPELMPRGERHGFALHPERRPRGERHPRHVLTDALVMALRQRFANGEQLRDISGDTKLSINTLRAAIRGATWAHLPLIPRQPRYAKRPTAAGKAVA